MRIFFMAVVAILFQLCTYALASGVQWLVRPWASDAILKAVMIGLFVISNVILLLLITGSFRIGMSYLSLQAGLSGVQRDYLSQINKSGSLLLDMVNRILDFSSANEGLLRRENRAFHHP